ncbi:ribonucleotide reductase [Streptomyces phage Blueeyedbeauty]|uniref:Ribonucleotide reductase n=1 Tax=Streptomyces phage Blueeyedbeauty TaxID=2250336 RepID=A0A345L1L4_9CAUD|nr:ribonucleotide reductase [Streptomyces phage Blueeyedbeauty]AXH49166.1 ribonucleotide reductase [Streptomyces phage Blueeyedbeauty]
MDFIDATGRISDPYRNFIHLSRYSRWLEDEGRRETWVETVNRYMDFMLDHLKKNNGYEPPQEHVNLVHNFIMEHRALPSMRALMTAGPALERNNIAGYNCSYVVVDNPVAFDEILYILMNGTGVGFSAEERYVSQLPVIPQLHDSDNTIVVEDSKEGWAHAYHDLVAGLYNGVIQKWDVSKVRPAGARLKTFGGRASGPAPLVELFEFTVSTFLKAQGRKLTDLEAHDIVCEIASVVVVGGVRRSALISLGDLGSDGHRTAKSGAWWEKNGQRALANNSAVFDSKPSREVFDNEWQALIDSGSGERGIFNREASRKQAAKFGRRSHDVDYGTNPCSEIILRPNQFCNLSTVVVEADDTYIDLAAKVRAATILGTWQSTLTNFKYLRPLWKQNTEQERLLGVSMTGPFGNKLLNGTISFRKTEDILVSLRFEAVKTNQIVADDIGIPRSAAITCVKPEGTTSQLTLTSSGLHAWHNDEYIRTVRGDRKDPLSQFLIDSGFPYEPDVMNPENTVVFSFPIKAPEGAITRHELDAKRHLDLWMLYQRAWCEHKPSVTIYVKPEEWDEVGDWVYENFDEVSGISFLPHSEHTYQQAPYQDISTQEYNEWLDRMPKDVDWDMLSSYEVEDTTTGTQELACTAGACDVVDISK